MRLAAAVVASIAYHRLAASKTSCTCKLLRFQKCQGTDFQDPGVLFPAVCWYEHVRWQSQATVVIIVASNRVSLAVTVDRETL